MTIDKWSTTSDNLMKQKTFVNQRKESASSTSENPKQSGIPHLKVDALDKKWKGGSKDALKKARDTTLKWTNMSQKLKGETQKEVPNDDKESKRTQVQIKLRGLVGRMIQVQRAAKLLNEGADKRNQGFLLPKPSSKKVPVGFLPRKV